MSRGIRELAEAVGVGTATHDEIDKLNILNATHLAMHRALDEVFRLKYQPSDCRLLIDGDCFKSYKNIDHVCIPKGDATHLCIAAASIIAKTARDAHVYDCCDRHPELDTKYGFKSNKAYGTKTHLQGLVMHGPDPRFHRMTFGRVKTQE